MNEYMASDICSASNTQKERDILHDIWLESGIWRKWSYTDFVKDLMRIMKKYEPN